MIVSRIAQLQRLDRWQIMTSSERSEAITAEAVLRSGGEAGYYPRQMSTGTPVPLGE